MVARTRMHAIHNESLATLGKSLIHETFIFKCLSQSVPEGCVQEDGQEHHLGEQEHIK